MGILDELKTEASEIAAQKDSAQAKNRQAQQASERMLNPRMQSIYKYLSELTEQLAATGREITTDFPIKGIGKLKALRQSDFVLARSEEDVGIEHGFNLRFRLANGRRYRVKISGAANIRSTEKQLHESGIACNVQTTRSGPTGPEAATLALEGKLDTVFQFRPNAEKRTIALTTVNFETLETVTHEFKCEVVDNVFLDQLGRYLLRESNTLLERKVQLISKAQRAALQARLAAEAREREIAMTERTITPVDAKKYRSLFARLRGTA